MKKTNRMTIIAIAVLSVVVLTSLVAGTYARYASTFEKEAVATAASWSFVSGDVATQYTLTADATTYPNLKAGTIAPGTSGSFDIVLDGTGSETGIEYDVTIAPAAGTTLPAGLTLNTTAINGKIAYSEVANAMKKTVTVNWEWTLGDDAGDANYDANAETGDNNADAGTSYTFDITVRGEQYLEAII